MGEKNIPRDTINELVLDGGFVMPKTTSDGFEAPEINSFGHSFRFVLAASVGVVCTSQITV